MQFRAKGIDITEYLKENRQSIQVLQSSVDERLHSILNDATASDVTLPLTEESLTEASEVPNVPLDHEAEDQVTHSETEGEMDPLGATLLKGGSE